MKQLKTTLTKGKFREHMRWSWRSGKNDVSETWFEEALEQTIHDMRWE